MSKFCSIDGSASYIDTHLVALRASDPAAIAKEIKDDGLLKHLELVPDILHESVHHWCFTTPVGNALLLLWQEVVERSLTDKDGSALWPLYARYELVVELLRPVVEGIACFAEFDVRPGAGAVRIPPLAWLALALDPVRSAGIDQAVDQDALIDSALGNVRSRRQLAKRKEAVLLQALDPSVSGGYLLGYLVLKGSSNSLALALEASPHSRLACDTELHASLFKACIFDDHELAMKILSPPRDIIDDLDDIKARVHRSISRVADGELMEKMVVRWNELHESGDAGSAAVYQAQSASILGYDEAATVELQAEFATRSTGLGTAVEPAIDAWRSFTRALIDTKEGLCLSSTPGSVLHQADVVVFSAAGGTPEYEIARASLNPKVIDLLQSNNGDAALEVWLDNGFFLTIASGDGIHSVEVIWASEDQLVAFAESAKSNNALLHLSEGLRDIARHHMASQPAFDMTHELVHDQICPEEHLRQASLALQAFSVPNERHGDWWPGGLGLFAPLNDFQAMVRSTLATYGDHDQALVNRIDSAASERCGATLAGRSGTRILL